MTKRFVLIAGNIGTGKTSLTERIGARLGWQTSFESGDYLSLLESLYDEWIDIFDLCPVLTIPSESLDFVHKPYHLDIVIERMEEKLAGKDQVVFPNGDDA